MRHFLIILFILPLFSQAQQSVMRETERSVLTYPFSDPDPIARFGRIYPYFRYDGYAHKGVQQKWTMVELENDYIRIAVSPGLGGKVWEAYEKSTNYPFIFSNHVVKFRDVALRGPWTSGGLEFNFGDIGHSPTTSAPVDYFVRKNADGSVSCFIGATDWSARTTWRVEINLAPDKAYFTTRAWWNNGTPFEQEYYHWTNAGFRAVANLEFVFPGDHYIGHVGEVDTYPLDSAGHTVSFYDKNNFGSYKSYHVLGRPTDFYGGFWHGHNMGVGHWAPYYKKLGKKAWSWGLSRQGLMWENLLTDTDGPNVELQSGRLFNQASPGSINSPFKHFAFAPYSTDTWTEFWYPVKGTRGLNNGSTHGALNLRTENEWLKIDWMALENQNDTLKIFSGTTPLLSKRIELKPMQLYRDSIRWSGDANQLKVKFGTSILTNDSTENLNRPLHAPADFDWQSEFGLMLKGTDLCKQKNYVEGEIYLAKALDKNPNMVPALTQMAQIRFRQGNYDASREFARRALAVNTYDAEANYWWGLSSEKTGHAADAVDGFSVAALSLETRSAALLRLAYIKIAKSEWKEAAELITQSNTADANDNADDALLVVLRKLGRKQEASALIEKRLANDPLNHLTRFEKSLITGNTSALKEFVQMIRQEWAHETFIELSLFYYHLNLPNEALQIISLAPKHPVVDLWKGYMQWQKGMKQEALASLSASAAMSTDLVFPFRPEMYPAYEWAQQQHPSWKWSFYEALTRWQFNEPEIVKTLFAKAGVQPDVATFYLTKAVIFKSDSNVVKASLEKAWRLDPKTWRTGWRLSQFYTQQHHYDQAMAITKKSYAMNPDNYVVGLQYAYLLELTNHYAEALKLLDNLSMLPAELPSEGHIDAHNVFRETNILYAAEKMKAGHYNDAVTLLKKAETWPEHLGTGEPYFADNRLTQFLLSYCYKKSKDMASQRKSLDYIKSYSNHGRKENVVGGELTRLAKGDDLKYRDVVTALKLKATGFDRTILDQLHLEN